MLSEQDREKFINRVRYSSKPNMMAARLYWDILNRDKDEDKEPTDAKD